MQSRPTGSIQVRGLRARLRPVARPRPHMLRQLTPGHRPTARAPFGLRHMLGHLRRRCRLDVGDLMAALRRHRFIGQVSAAPAAGGRRVLEPLIRIIDELHRRPGLGRMLSGGPPSPLPQRPVLPVFLYGLSDDGGRDDVDESLRTRRLRSSTSADSRSTRAVSSPISRYASASSGGGSADSSSAEGTSGTPSTAHNHRHPGPQVNNPRQRVANPPALVNPGRAATSASCAACAPPAPQRRLPRCPNRHQGSSWIVAGIGSRPDSHATKAHASTPRRSLDGTVASSLGSAQAT
jgi:hypothetical protein